MTIDDDPSVAGVSELAALAGAGWNIFGRDERYGANCFTPRNDRYLIEFGCLKPDDR